MAKKFKATSIVDLLSANHNRARAVRREYYAQEGQTFSHVILCEASDGSWCEFDGETLFHAIALADNAVDKLGARGCSVWEVLADGTLPVASSYSVYAE